MAMPKLLPFFLLQLVFIISVSKLAYGQGLTPIFYKKTCPNLEKIVKQTTAQFIYKGPSLAGPLLRMHFHDCFVRGCDGSVLLNSTRGNTAEKAAFPNQSLRGFQVIDAVKSAVEKRCPRLVSCADILALVARDVVSMMKGPSWPVPLGRRDGRISRAQDALNNLPGPSSNITQLKASFRSKGLNVKDLAVLSGGHTLGVSHCTSFTNRLYNFTGKGDTDPSMDKNYISFLKTKCKPRDTNTIVEMDPGSSKKFDISYYTVVSKRRGLFESDAALLTDRQTKAYVQQHLYSAGTSSFFRDFSASMIKMSQIGVLTGKNGEIRRKCAFVN